MHKRGRAPHHTGMFPRGFTNVFDLLALDEFDVLSPCAMPSKNWAALDRTSLLMFAAPSPPSTLTRFEFEPPFLSSPSSPFRFFCFLPARKDRCVASCSPRQTEHSKHKCKSCRPGRPLPGRPLYSDMVSASSSSSIASVSASSPYICV